MTETETGLGIEAKSPAIYELLEEGSAVERMRSLEELAAVVGGIERRHAA